MQVFVGDEEYVHVSARLKLGNKNQLRNIEVFEKKTLQEPLTFYYKLLRLS